MNKEMNKVQMAKSYLRQIRILELRIKQDKDRLETLRANLGGCIGISYDRERVQTPPKDSLSEEIAALVDLEQKIVSDTVTFEKKRNEIVQMIRMLNDAACEEVLYLRWVCQLDFSSISEQMSYSLRQVHKIHSKALTMLARFLSRASA